MSPPLPNGFFIDGARRAGSANESHPVTDPATGEVVAEVAVASDDDIDEAVRSARAAFNLWKKVSARERRDTLKKVADAVKAEADPLGELLARENGKPLNQAKGEVVGTAGLIEYYAEEALRVSGDVLPSDHPKRMVMVWKEPVGVVAAVTPWNFPLALLGRMLGPGLAAGCTVVAKPASDTPLSTIRLAEICHDAGLPPGAFNVVTGPGGTVGEKLIGHPDIRKVSFTGSLEIGRRVMELASKNIKGVTLELGGQCPAIVCSHADLTIAPDALIFQGFKNSGQVCNRVNRIYAHSSIYENLIEIMTEKMSGMITSHAFDPDADIGPIINERQGNHIHNQVVDGLAKGARLTIGGERLVGPDYDSGFFYPPTLLADTNHEMLVMTEETFGPLLGIMPYDDLNQAIEWSNDTEYGLSSFVFSGDLRTGINIASQLDAGSVYINDIFNTYVQAPYGGMKESGLGREQGSVAINEYLEIKTVYMDLAKKNRGGYPFAH
ncbi:aldehyde dehydrogenase family protein [candidate division KSB1 bacterium]